MCIPPTVQTHTIRLSDEGGARRIIRASLGPSRAQSLDEETVMCLADGLGKRGRQAVEASNQRKRAVRRAVQDCGRLLQAELMSRSSQVRRRGQQDKRRFSHNHLARDRGASLAPARKRAQTSLSQQNFHFQAAPFPHPAYVGRCFS